MVLAPQSCFLGGILKKTNNRPERDPNSGFHGRQPEPALSLPKGAGMMVWTPARLLTASIRAKDVSNILNGSEEGPR